LPGFGSDSCTIFRERHVAPCQSQYIAQQRLAVLVVHGPQQLRLLGIVCHDSRTAHPRFRSPFAEHNDVIWRNRSIEIFADPIADRLRIPGMNRRAARTRTTYLVSDRLHAGRTARVAVHEIASTVSAWLAELGAHSPLAEDLARAVRAGDWPAARGIGDYLSVDVSIA
jgi:hypothetical protein